MDRVSVLLLGKARARRFRSWIRLTVSRGMPFSQVTTSFERGALIPYNGVTPRNPAEFENVKRKPLPFKLI
jgi:hypothetical protein